MIFDEQISRKPDNYPWTQEFIEAMHNGFWTHREFNFSSDISGKLCVRKEELFNFQEDLLRLIEKYHLPVYDFNINIKSKSDLRSFWADSGFLQVHFHNNKKDIKEILHKHRGKITGNKFGL